MRAFVTGGTGFIGGHLVRMLLAQGHQVVALVRSEEKAAPLRELGAEVTLGDIVTPNSFRDAMSGCDVVFHLAAWYKIGAVDWQQAERMNVGGTRKVLQTAWDLGVKKIVYVSTVAVFGHTKGVHADESYRQKGGFRTEYDRTKWLAHYRVALPLIEQGAPIIIAMPGGVYGPGDNSLIGEIMRRFYAGKIPVLPGPEFTITYAHVEDIAAGILLTAEKGRIGESYILAGPAVSLGEMVDYWARISRIPAPFWRIPARYIRPFVPFMEALSHFITVPQMYSSEAMDILDMTYKARADKANKELGWQPRSLKEGIRETFAAIIEETPEPKEGLDTKQKAGLVLAGTAVLAILLFIFRLNKKRSK